MDEPTYTMTEKQWHQINDALCAAIGITSVHAKECHEQMLKAGILMDDLANVDDDAQEEI